MPSSRAEHLVHGRRRLLGAAVAASVACSVAAAILGAPFLGSADVAATSALPACRFDDVLTAPRGFDSWAVTLVDTILMVPSDDAPQDLVSVSEAAIGGSGLIRAVAIPDLRAMASAARRAGNPIAVSSAYRSYATQAKVFQSWVKRVGYSLAVLHTARPGHSEHQLGLAIDFETAGSSPPSTSDWGTTPAGAWMRLHAWEYGWVQSYPKDRVAETCYQYEPWHFRYVGRAVASEIHRSGLTPREYLWDHFTTATVAPATGSPRPTAPLPETSPTASAISSLVPGSSSEASDRPSASPIAPPSSPAVGPPEAGPGIDVASATAAAGLIIGIASIGSAMTLGFRRRRRSNPQP